MFNKTILSLAIAALATLSANARTINIHGKVTIKGSGEPVPAVVIRNGETNKIIGGTDDDGNYLITADSEGTLFLESLTCDDMTVEIDDRMKIDIEMIRSKNVLQEIVAIGKGSKKTFVMEDAELEIDGNMMKIKRYPVHIPPKLFSSDKRLIIQPAIYNVTRQHLSYLNPVVVDGKHYAITQERMDDWDTSVDPLTPYRRIKQGGNNKESNTFYITDSLYLENPSDDVFALIMPMIEDYNKVVYRDSFEVARGIINPFRWLKFSLDPMDMNDPRYIPNDVPEPRDNVGEMNLMFEVGKSKLNPSLGSNESELNALVNEFTKIYNDPNSTLKGFSIYGSASPEGSYETNSRLAKDRMNSALTWIKNSVNLKKNVDVSYEAEVAPWENVVKMLRADSLFEEADRVQTILDKYSGSESRTAAMSRLPFYKTLLAETYLPRMRRVNYNIKTEYYRPLTDAEIDELYKTDPSQLAKHHYYRYYSVRQGDEREAVLRNAVKAHPDFYVAATDLSKIMLEKGEDPYSLLEPYFVDYRKWKTLPVSTRYNFGVAAMNNMKYSLADSLFETVPELPETHKAKMYCQVMTGNYMDVIEEVCEDSPLNEVLILLKMRNNGAAWSAAQKLGDSAVEEYIKAIAAHRVDDYQDLDFLESALRKDPSLLETAKIDGDVVDMLENIDLENLFNNPVETESEDTETETTTITETTNE